MVSLAYLSENETVVIGLLIVSAAVCAISIVLIVARHWRRVRIASYNARLKQLMIERGWSADEIERVLGAEGRLDAASLRVRGCCGSAPSGVI